MRKAVNDRVILSGLVVAPLSVVIFSIPWIHTNVETLLNLRPWAHMTLEACLNVLWLGLAVGALVYWPPGGSRRRQPPGFVSLVFVLALLFPVISASDDQAQWAFINDAKTSQSVTTSLNTSKHLTNCVATPCFPAFAAPPPTLRAALMSVAALTPVHVSSVITFGDATGNHSPPLC